LQGLSFEESAICGVAAGTANTLMLGAGQFKLEDFQRLRGQIRISDRIA
jgi:fructose-1-phosphate kinase PfkB-like protein